jgi:hypothetical protein
VDAELSPIPARRRPYHPNAVGMAAVAELVLAAPAADHRGTSAQGLTLAYRRSSQEQQTFGTPQDPTRYAGPTDTVCLQNGYSGVDKAGAIIEKCAAEVYYDTVDA